MEIFLLGIIGLAAIVMLILLACDQKFWGGVLLLAAIGLLLKQNWETTTFNTAFFVSVGMYAGAFIGAGLLFSLLKWKMHTVKIAKLFQEFLSRKNFDKDGEEAVEAHKQRRGSEQTNSMLEQARDKGIQQAREYAAQRFNQRWHIVMVQADEGGGWKTTYDKAELAQYATAWTVFWPFYAVLLIMNDFVVHLVEAFVSRFGRIFRQIADSSFASIE